MLTVTGRSHRFMQMAHFRLSSRKVVSPARCSSSAAAAAAAVALEEGPACVGVRVCVCAQCSDGEWGTTDAQLSAWGGLHARMESAPSSRTTAPPPAEPRPPAVLLPIMTAWRLRPFSASSMVVSAWMAMMALRISACLLARASAAALGTASASMVEVAAQGGGLQGLPLSGLDDGLSCLHKT